MQELLVVNPSKRPSKRRKAASPAQKRARAAFAAMARARAGKKRTHRKAKRATSRKSTSLSIMSNPRKRRHHARRRNPVSTSLVKKPMSILSPALVGALGATAVNTILAKVPLPASLNTGKMKYVTQGIAAIALGAVASKLGVRGSMAAQMAEGSLTVTLHQAITDIAGGMGMNLSGVGYYLPGYGVARGPSPGANPARMAGMNGMGKYLTGPGAPRSNVMPMPSPVKQTMRGFGFR